MPSFETKFPPVLLQLHSIDIDYDDGEGMDFEPYSEFQSPDDNTSWIQAWTGNDSLDGAEYRVFGQDGTGGYAAFWMVRKGRPVLEQPVVFFGSEGELGVVACNFSDYLWLLAGGVGPMEAIEYGASGRKPNEDFLAFARKHSNTGQKTAQQVIDEAKAEFPRFAEDIRALCK